MGRAATLVDPRRSRARLPPPGEGADHAARRDTGDVCVAWQAPRRAHHRAARARGLVGRRGIPSPDPGHALMGRPLTLRWLTPAIGAARSGAPIASPHLLTLPERRQMSNVISKKAMWAVVGAGSALIASTAVEHALDAGW